MTTWLPATWQPSLSQPSRGESGGRFRPPTCMGRSGHLRRPALLAHLPAAAPCRKAPDQTFSRRNPVVATEKADPEAALRRLSGDNEVGRRSRKNVIHLVLSIKPLSSVARGPRRHISCTLHLKYFLCQDCLHDRFKEEEQKPSHQKSSFPGMSNRSHLV